MTDSRAMTGADFAAEAAEVVVALGMEESEYSYRDGFAHFRGPGGESLALTPMSIWWRVLVRISRQFKEREAAIRANERAKVRALIQRAHDLLTDDRLNVEPPCYPWENDVGDLCRDLRAWMAQP